MGDNLRDHKPAANPQDDAHAAFEAESLEVSLTVANLPASLAWYRDVVGFGVDKEYERGGVLQAVSLRAGNVRVLLGQDDGARGADRTKGEGFSMQFSTALSIDAVAARIRSHGGTLAAEPMDTPWGVRILRLVDPDGFRFVV